MQNVEGVESEYLPRWLADTCCHVVLSSSSSSRVGSKVVVVVVVVVLCILSERVVLDGGVGGVAVLWGGGNTRELCCEDKVGAITRGWRMEGWASVCTPENIRRGKGRRWGGVWTYYWRIYAGR